MGYVVLAILILAAVGWWVFILGGWIGMVWAAKKDAEKTGTDLSAAVFVLVVIGAVLVFYLFIQRVILGH